MRSRDLRRHLLARSAVAIVAPLIVIGAACGSSKSTTTPTTTSSAPTSTTSTGSTGSTGSTLDKIPSGTATVDNTTTALGTVLVDGTGFVLYVFTPDGTGPPTCVDTCATAWPPVTGSAIAVAKNIQMTPGEFKLVARPDGTMQLTANGHPLYRYSGDTKPGETNGQGLGNQWYVAGADGNPIKG
jgi:predicted lipoprotein with Yx(FWY)xxD motif